MFEFLKKFSGTYQYIYSALFPKQYVPNDKFGIQNKVPFTFYYGNWKENKIAEDNFKQLANSLVNFDRKIEVFEQRPFTASDFQQHPAMALYYLQSAVPTQSVLLENQKYQLPKQIKQIKVINDLKAKTQLDLKQKKKEERNEKNKTNKQTNKQTIV